MMAAEPDHGDGTGNVCKCCWECHGLLHYLVHYCVGGRASGLPNATDAVWRQVTAFYRRQGKGHRVAISALPGRPLNGHWAAGRGSRGPRRQRWRSLGGPEPPPAARRTPPSTGSSGGTGASSAGCQHKNDVCERFRKEAVRLPRRLPRRPKATQASVWGCTCGCSQPVLRQFREFRKGKKRVLII